MPPTVNEHDEELGLAPPWPVALPKHKAIDRFLERTALALSAFARASRGRELREPRVNRPKGLGFEPRL